MLTREEQVAICETCTQRKPTLQGLMCGITNEKAAFEESCPDYTRDAQEVLNLEKQRKEAVQADYAGVEVEASILNGGIIGGSLAIVGALVWFFGALIYMDRIFFYPPILLVIGIISLIRGIKAQNEKKKKNLREKDVLDSEL